MAKTDGDTLLMRETLLTVERIGKKNTVALLRKMRVATDDNACDVLSAQIIKAVCNKFSISKKHLLQDTSGTNRVDALCMCTYLIKEFLGYSNRTIAQMLNRQSHKSIGHYVARLNALDPRHPVDKEFIAYRDYLKIEIGKFKEALPKTQQ